MRPFYGYSPVGENAIKKVSRIKTRKYSLCAAVNCDGSKFTKIIQTNYNSEAFIDFLTDFFIWV